MEFAITSVDLSAREFSTESLQDGFLIHAVFSFDKVKEEDMPFVKEGHVFNLTNGELFFIKEFWTEKDLKDIEREVERFEYFFKGP